jgi:hypothetical protein
MSPPACPLYPRRHHPSSQGHSDGHQAQPAAAGWPLLRPLLRPTSCCNAFPHPPHLPPADARHGARVQLPGGCAHGQRAPHPALGLLAGGFLARHAGGQPQLGVCSPAPSPPQKPPVQPRSPAAWPLRLIPPLANRHSPACLPAPLQALVGQQQEAVDLHSNFTSVWQSYGWMPEAYSIDTSRINPDDPGYNLRPEHVESTYLLHATTGNPRYLKTARSLLQVGWLAGQGARHGGGSRRGCRGRGQQPMPAAARGAMLGGLCRGLLQVRSSSLASIQPTTVVRQCCLVVAGCQLGLAWGCRALATLLDPGKLPRALLPPAAGPRAQQGQVRLRQDRRRAYRQPGRPPGGWGLQEGCCIKRGWAFRWCSPPLPFFPLPSLTHTHIPRPPRRSRSFCPRPSSTCTCPSRMRRT